MRLLFASALITLSLSARADCMDRWVRVSPAEGSVPPRPHLLLVVGGSAPRLDPAKGLEFVGPSGVVAVEVIASFPGFRQTIAHVRPKTALTPATWRLVAKPTSRDQHPAPLGTWQVDPRDDVTPPAFRSSPAIGEARLVPYGCGPARLVPVTLSLDDERALVEATVTGDDGKALGPFIVAPKNGAVELGHSMCAGALVLPPSRRFTVTLVPIDLSGNRGQPSAPLSFRTPEEF